MRVERKVPEIRFQGFSGEWAEAALSDVIDVRSGKDYKHLGKGKIPVYGTGGYMLSVDSALSNDEDAIGIGRKGTIDKPYLLRSPFWTVDTLFYAVPKPKFKLDYLYCVFQKIDWEKHDESTGVPSLSKVAINNIPIRVTSEEEQTVIGNYFQKLDSLINQHQQKHDQLSNIKKAMLEKMFPKQGEAVPEIRFKGFSGEWEMSELAKLALFNPREELPTSFKYVDLESVKGTSLIGYREELKENAPSRAQRLAKKGDVFFQTVRPYQKNNYLFNKGDNDFVFSTGYAQLRPLYDGEFLLNLIQREPFVKNVLDNCTGTSYPAINASILASLEVSYPESKEEQTAIGNYFQKLDALINQHQEQITKLTNIKQACLSKMFV